MKRIYYFENPVGVNPDHGSFTAESDKEALKEMPSGCWCLYRESDTPDGLPFVVLYDHKDGPMV